MTEPSQKKQKDQAPKELYLVSVGAAQAAAIQDPRRWWTEHKVRPGEINLHEFADGALGLDLLSRKQLHIGFAARPYLIAELAPYIRLWFATSPSTTTQNINPSLRTWWRVFDECDAIAPVKTLSDLNEIHNATYLRKSSNSHKHYSIFMSVIRLARQDLGLPVLFWAAPQRPSPTKGLVDARAVSLIYHYLKRLRYPDFFGHSCFGKLYQLERL